MESEKRISPEKWWREEAPKIFRSLERRIEKVTWEDVAEFINSMALSFRDSEVEIPSPEELKDISREGRDVRYELLESLQIPLAVAALYDGEVAAELLRKESNETLEEFKSAAIVPPPDQRDLVKAYITSEFLVQTYPQEEIFGKVRDVLKNLLSRLGLLVARED